MDNNEVNSFSISDFNSLMYTTEWEYQVKLIIELMNGDDEVDGLIENYENFHNRKFSFDYIRYMYSYLKHIMIDQALYIYDTLAEDHKEVFVDVIKQCYPHLHDIIEVHEVIKFVSMDTETTITS